jgi:uncharacterized protein (DUF1501 family)
MRRRRFLRLAAHSLGCGLAVSAWPLSVFAARGARLSKAAPAKRLAVIFLRGGLDGLSVLPPYDDPLYRRARPTLALPGPGLPGGVIGLGEGLGMHPALAPLEAFWRDGRLAFVQGCGFADAPSEHEPAQRIFENADPAGRGKSGWMNRLCEAMGAVKGAPALSFAPRRPRIMKGRLWTRNYLTRGAAPLPAADGMDIFKELGALYRDDQTLGKTFAQALAMRRKLLASLGKEMQDSAAGAPGPAAFPGMVESLLRAWKRYPGSRLAFLGVGGFDVHYGQGGARGYLDDALRDVARGLAMLAEGLGRDFEHTVVVVASEFGRTVRENETGGTDNGHGGALWLLGGPVAGGRIYGSPPELSRLSLREGRDLPVDVDFREILSVIAAKHFSLDDKALGMVFPGFTASGDLADIIR